MRKKDQLAMEKRIREVTHVENPSQEFVESLRQKIVGRESPSMRYSGFQSLSHRPVWFFLVIGFIVVTIVYFIVGPQKVHAFIEDFNFLDPGLETVAEAGMVTELDMFSQFTVQGLDDSAQAITVILDWVYIDEGRLVLGFITESIPSGMALGLPTVIAEQSLRHDLAFSSISEEDNPDQIIFSAYSPIKLDSHEKQVSFGVDLPLLESDDPAKAPLAVFHFEIEGVPVHKGETFEMEQPSPALVDDLEFQFKTFKFSPSFTMVTFCVDMSPKEFMALPKSDISLQIGDGPALYHYLFLGISEDEGKTCVQIGFLDSVTPEDEKILFRFKHWAVVIMQSSHVYPIESPEPFRPQH